MVAVYGIGMDIDIVAEFHKLSNDELIKDKDIMLVTIDVGVNRMLAARMGVAIK